MSNYIRTTKYTALSFIPMSLFNQFRRYANIYFLITAIMQSIPAISPLNPLSAIAPLVFVISLSIIREGFEDLKRYRSDLTTNSKKTKRFLHQSKEWETDVEWKDLYVGDVIRVEDQEYLPADLIVLASSSESGACFIQTSSLDGEKNLKPKFALPEVQDGIMDGKTFRIIGQLKYEQPNFDLYSFNGVLRLSQNEEHVLGAKQMLLRDSQLKNTEYVVGVVVYTGYDTKVMQNQDKPRFKLSQIEAQTNTLILLIILLEVAMCLVIMVGSAVWNSENAENFDYFIPERYSGVVEGLLSFFTVFILLNTMIPISLIISLEMVKFTQAYFIDNDADMKGKEGGLAKSYNSSITEELGQIEFVFSDKTGTLTCNIMEFQCCFIGDTFFGDHRLLRKPGQEEPQTLRRQTTYKNKKAEVEYSFEDKRLRSLLRKEGTGKEESFKFRGPNREVLYRIENLQQLVEDFFLILSINHDCMVEEEGEAEGLVNYQGPSPDEVALVDTARHMGYQFKNTTNIGKVVTINGTDTEFEVLQVFQFTSKRKRSSNVIRQNGVIKLLIKGADNIILGRLDQKAEQPYLEQTVSLLKDFSQKGYRTLCYGLRVLSEEEWSQFASEIQAVGADAERKRKMEEIADRVESGLTLLGCTAVEDKLQDEVPEVIADLIEANIKVWMLTGDKLETAENIGFSCRLIQQDFQKLYLRADKKVKKYGEPELRGEYRRLREQLEQRRHGDKFCLIVEGPLIINLTKFTELAKQFILEVFAKCDSVVCCRMSPKQKGEIVRFVKRYQSKITLAIGDGANDVNMIQEAHIGIGLFGKEGMQAVQASDFALREFRHLWKLLFVHGRWSYIRNSEMILYFYYKNIVFALPQFFYCFFNAFSGQTFFDDFYITFYNLAFTCLPVIVRAIFDQDIYYREFRTRLTTFNDLKKHYHHLYYVGQKNLIFDKRVISLWLASSLVTGTVIFFVGYAAAQSWIINRHGEDLDLWFLSITVYTVVIFVVDVKILFFTRYFTWYSIVSIFVFSLGIYFLYFLLADFIKIFYVYKTALTILSSPIFYLTLFLMTGTAIIFDTLVLVVQKETRTPLYLLFKSLMERELSSQDKQGYFNAIVTQIKEKLFNSKEDTAEKNT